MSACSPSFWNIESEYSSSGTKRCFSRVGGIQKVCWCQWDIVEFRAIFNFAVVLNKSWRIYTLDLGSIHSMPFQAFFCVAAWPVRSLTSIVSSRRFNGSTRLYFMLRPKFLFRVAFRRFLQFYKTFLCWHNLAEVLNELINRTSLMKQISGWEISWDSINLKPPWQYSLFRGRHLLRVFSSELKSRDKSGVHAETSCQFLARTFVVGKKSWRFGQNSDLTACNTFEPWIDFFEIGNLLYIL